MNIFGLHFVYFSILRRPRPIPGIASSSKLAEKEKDERMSAGRRRTTNQRTASLRTEGNNRSSLNGSSDEESETDSRVNEDDEEEDEDSEPQRVSYFFIPDRITNPFRSRSNCLRPSPATELF